MMCCVLAEPGHTVAAGVLEAVARSCSPRVAPHGTDGVVFDAAGLSRVLGAPASLAREVARLATTAGVVARVAVSGTMTSAWVLAHAHTGITVVELGGAADALAPVPVGWLGSIAALDRVVGASTSAANGDRVVSSPPRSPQSRGRGGHYRVAPPPLKSLTWGGASEPVERARANGAGHRAPASERVGGTAGAEPPRTSLDRQWEAACRDRLETLARWGVRTCGQLAALPRADIHARMGAVGVRLHQAACGEDTAPLVPVPEATTWCDRMTLEWPVEGLEPLSFVLARQCERLSRLLEQADRGAVALHTTLTLVNRTTHVRSLSLPAPIRDARVLRTLIVLDLESHPPGAGIDAVEIRCEVTPGRILQGSLLSWPLPTPEDASTLIARLGALMGETRVGAPVRLDTHDGRVVAQRTFTVPTRAPFGATLAPASPRAGSAVTSALRRFRMPVPVRVTVERGTPVWVATPTRGLTGGAVAQAAGPWRHSGGWWTDGRAVWDRDEWDVEVAGGVVYRLTRQRASNTWELDGVFD